MRKKPLQSSIKAIKRAFNLSFGVVFSVTILAIVLFGSYIALAGATIFEDDFDDYADGTLHGKDGWTCSYDTWLVNSDDYYTSPKSIKDEASSYVSLCQKDGSYQTEGSFSFWFKTTNCGYGETRREELNFRFSGTPYENLPYIVVKSTIEEGCYIGLSNVSEDYVAYDTFDDWTQVSVFWKVKIDDYYWFKWRWGENAGTDWIKGIYTISHFPSGFNRLYVYGSYGAGGNYFFVDSIKEAVSFCSIFTDFNSCTSAGCFWGYFSLYLGGTPTGYCTDLPTGECGSGYNDCQNCTSQATCEAQNFCFWYLDTCRYGETACAGTSLWLCENQSDCENAGGYWYDDFCWLSAKPTYFESWEDWYEEHGNYETPSPFVDSLASSTTGFIEFFGGFFDTFNNFFNLQDATERGLALGGVVPVGRGYLTIFNDFLGGFPISEFFIFFLTFVLVIGIIRLFSRLLPLLKFW